LVLAKYISEENIEFLGWSTKQIMKKQPIKIFSSLGIENYFLDKKELQNMSMLDRLFQNNKIEQIF
jgi:hypothetical protein